MLIIERDKGEILRIGDDILIKFNGADRCTVQGQKTLKASLSIVAPKEVSVHREEYYRKLVTLNGGKGLNGGEPLGEIQLPPSLTQPAQFDAPARPQQKKQATVIIKRRRKVRQP